MSVIEASQESEIYIGIPFSFTLEPTLDDETVPSNSLIRATLISNVSAKKATEQLTTPIILAYSTELSTATNSIFTGTFSESQIANLLETPSDPNSALRFSSIYLECEIDSAHKVHVPLSVSKGVL